MKIIAGVLLLFAVCAARAEIFFEIQYQATLGEVKKLYPNAAYEKLRPAWLKPEDAFIKVSGMGLPVTLRIAFEDLRPAAREMLKNPEHADSAFMKEIANNPDDVALTVSWVRVSYPSPISLELFKRRYGAPAKCEVDEAFNNECKWEKSAIVGTMSDDGKFVQSATTDFTLEEKRNGYLLRGMSIPPWLK